MSDTIKVYGFGCSEDDKVTDGVFLHGMLEDLNPGAPEPDLCYIPELPNTDGVYSCEVQTTTGVLVSCLLYLWFTSGWGLTARKNRGLVVLATDEKAVEDARTKYFERREWL